MAKILLQYEADTKQLTAELKKVETANKKVDDSSKKTGASLTNSFLGAAKAAGTVERETYKVNAALAETSKVGNSASNVFKQVAAGIGAAFTVQKIIQFADASIKAFTDSQAKTEKLKFVLDNITKDGGSFDRLIKQSETLQDTLQIFDSEDIQGVQAMQAQFGLTANQIEKLTPLILELSSAQKIDLTSATDIALKAIEGQTRGLKTVGASFEDTGNSVDNYNKLIENLAKLQGSAANELNTVNGQLKAQEVAAGNLQEQIGSKLIPVFLELKNSIIGVGATLTNLVFPDEAIISARKEINDLQNTLTKKFETTPTAELKQQIVDVTNEIQKLKSSVKDVPFGFDRGEKIQEIINQVSYLNKTQLALRQIVLQRGVDEKRTQEDAIRNTKLEALAKENLSVLTKKQLSDEIAQLKLRSDAQSKDVQDQIDRREKAIEEIAKKEKEAADKLFEQRKADAEKLRDERAKDFEKAFNDRVKELEAFDKLEESRKTNRVPEIIKAIESDTDANINALKEKYLKIGDFSKDAQQKLDDEINQVVLSGLQLQLAEAKAAGESTVDIESDINDLLISINQDKNDRILESDKKTNEERLQLVQEIIDTSIELSDRFLEFESSQTDERISRVEREKDAQLAAYDEQLAALENLNERGAYSDRVYEAKKKELLDKRLQAEKKADAELRKLKKEQAEQDKLKAIFDIIVNTSVAVSKLLATPFLAIAAGAAGALELAKVISTPIPKFFKGKSFVERGNNPAGIDTIPAYLNEGERIVTTENNRKHWDIYEAIENNEFKKFVQKHYVIPQLKAYKNEVEKRNQKDFAGNIASALISSHGGLTFYEADRIRKKGMTINNTKELAQLIGEVVANNTPKYYGRW